MLRHGNLTDEMAKVASKWWADQLRTPAMLDNGDPSETGAITHALALLAQSRSRQGRTPEQVDMFEEALYKNLLVFNFYAIGCDYGPCKLLADSAKEVGFRLGMSCLPWKTQMFFLKNGGVEVSLGYGGDRVSILEGTEDDTISV